jgi:hypothetical protein
MASKRRLQEQDIAQESMLDGDSDEQLSEDKNIGTDSNNERDTVQTDSTQWTDCTQNNLLHLKSPALQSQWLQTNDKLRHLVLQKTVHPRAFTCSFSL